MGSDIELPVDMKTDTQMDASGTGMSTENGGTHSLPPLDAEAKLVQCASNCQDTVFDIGTSADADLKREIDDDYVEVDIISPENAPDDIMAIEETVVGDSTEHSSSFSGSFSRTEDGSALSDGEVDSQYPNGHMSGCCFPEPYGGLPRRKKRLRDHWKNHIQPLKWRCQWLELRIKEIQTLARTYDKELAKYDERKQSLCEKFPEDAFGSKSLAFSSHIPRKKIMKRRKRERIEEIVDLASYVSNHNVLSYFAKKFPADRTLARDGTGDQAMANVIPSSGLDNPLRLRVCDSTMEEMLAKILMAQSHIQHLKARIEKVISENPGKFCSVNGLSSINPGSAGMISDEDPPSPPGIGQLSSAKSLYAASQLVSEGEPGHLLLPDHTIQDHGGMNALPDEVESTNQSKDGTLMNNWAVKEELLNFEKVGEVLVKSERELESQLKAPVESPSPLEASNVKSSPSKTYISNNKRKRKRRGAGLRWKSKRNSG